MMKNSHSVHLKKRREEEAAAATIHHHLDQPTATAATVDSRKAVSRDVTSGNFCYLGTLGNFWETGCHLVDTTV